MNQNDNITRNGESQYLVVHVHVVSVFRVRQVPVIIPNGVSDIPICPNGQNVILIEHVYTVILSMTIYDSVCTVLQ